MSAVSQFADTSDHNGKFALEELSTAVSDTEIS